MNIPNSTWPWLIHCGPREVRAGKGKEVLNIFIESAKSRCRDIRTLTIEEFWAYSPEKGMVFKRAEVWFEFFFKVHEPHEANYNFRIHTQIWTDVEHQICFTFQKGELGSAGYGTDWENIDYNEIMKYPFFKEAYEAFLKDVVSKIQEKFPGVLKE